MIVKATMRCFIGGRLRSPGEEFEIPDRPRDKVPKHLEIIEAAKAGRPKGPNTKVE